MRAVKIDFVLCEHKRELHKEIIENNSEDGTMLNSLPNVQVPARLNAVRTGVTQR